jgi:hypothetical protein
MSKIAEIFGGLGEYLQDPIGLKPEVIVHEKVPEPPEPSEPSP